MAFPVQKPKRRWGRAIFAWTLCVFAGGVAAGPTLQEYAYQGIDEGAFFIVTNAPPWVARYIPPSPNHLPPPSRSFAVPTALPPSAVPAAEAAAPVRAEQPSPPTPVAEKRSASTAPLIQPLAALPEAPAIPEPRSPSRGKHGKLAARATVHEAPPAPAPAPAARKSKQNDPFETAGADSDPAPTKREVAAAAPPKSEPAPRRARSSDGLDDLMGGSAAEGVPAAKGKRSTSREIDAMLKDVQKSEPPPPPKKSEPAALPALTASDITKAMTAVKTRANECGKSLGQKGMAELKLTVGKDGKVSNVTVAGKSAGSPLGECVARAARAASFPANAGLKFDYRIDVH
jgi:TonB family protein